MKEHRLVKEIINSSEEHSHRQELSVMQRYINPPKFVNLAFLLFQPHQCVIQHIECANPVQELHTAQSV